MSTTLKVLSAKKVIASHQINQGDALVIEARDKSNYQLIDDQTGLGPQNIITKREGKDLKIFLEDGDMNADVVIKNYYGNDQSEEVTNLLVGQHENGNMYAYVPESGLKSDAVSMLAEEVVAPQALGGEELTSAFWAFNPWWLLTLVPLVTGIAIAANNGSSGSSTSKVDAGESAEDLVKKAEEAEAAAEKLLKDANEDGTITPEEVKAIEDANKAVEEAKAKADAAVKALPPGTEGQEALQTRVDEVNPVAVPPISDPKAAAEDLVKKAEAAEAAAEKLLEDANKDGTITPEEVKAIEDANKAVEEAKAKADAAVKALPPGTEGQEALQTRVDEVNPVAVPPISDPKAAAEDLVKKAEEAEAAAEKLLKDANEDGTITPEEVKAIEDANKAVEEAKAKADAAVKALPPGTEGQEALQTRVDEVNPVAVPPISDPKAAAEDLVKKAEEAEAAAQKVLDDAKADNNITPEDVKAIEDANKAVEEAKAKADAAVKALPPGTEGQEALQTRVDEVNPVAVPPISDPKAAAEDLVKKAEEAEAAAQKVLDDAKADNNITPEDVKAIEDANKAVEEAKAKADAAVKALPPGTEGQEALQTRVDEVNPVAVPPISDPKAAAEDLVKKAEEAEAAAQKVLDDAKADNNITPEDVKAIEDANKAVEEAKAKADAAVKALPPGTEGQEALQTRVDEVNPVAVPPISDPKAAAEDLVKKAEEAEAAAQKVLDDAKADNNITPEDVKAIEDANKAVEEAKAKADAAVKALPPGTEGQEALQTRVDEVNPVAVPPISDPKAAAEDLVKKAEEAEAAAQKVLDDAKADNNITPEDVKAIEDANKAVEEAKAKADAAVKALPPGTEGQEALQTRVDEVNPVAVPPISDPKAAAEDLVKKAEEAEAAAQKVLDDAKADNNITPEDVKAIEDANKAVEEAKAKADAAVKALPPGTEGQEALQTRVDEVNPVAVPPISDPKAAAEDLVKKAEEAEAAAQKVLDDAKADNNITPEDVKAIEDANKAVEEAKAKADAAVKALPPGTEGQEALQTRVDEVNPVAVPPISDPKAAAEDLVKKAEEAEAAAQKVLDDAKADNNITPEDVKAIEDANKAVEEAKAKADAAVKALPPGTEGQEALQTRVDEVNPVAVPPISDPKAAAEDLVKKAEEAEAAAQKVLDDAKADNNITPEDVKAIEDANKAVEEAKAKADAAVKALPPGTEGQEALQTRVDEVNPVAVPPISDPKAAAEDLVKKAEEAEAAAQKVLDDAKADNNITPEDVKAIEDANKAVEEAKAKADAAVKALPPGTEGQEALQTRVDEVNPVAVPPISDPKAAAEDLVKKAEEAEAAAQKVLDDAKADNNITPEDVKAIEDANKAVEEAKAKADAAVKALPPGTEGQEALQTRVDEVNPVAVPPISDPKAAAEDLVKKAEEAEAAAQKVLDDAKADNNITPEDVKAIEDANKAVEEAKAKADAAVKALPPGTEGQEALQTRVDEVNPVAVPPISDPKAAAEDLVKKAEEAEAAAQKVLDDAKADNNITPEDVKAIEDANKAVEEAKAKADAAVKALPPGTEGQEALQTRVDEVNPVAVPPISDPKAAAEDLVKKAEEAEAAAQKVLDDAKADNNITPEDVKAIEDANKAVEEAKAKADAAVKALPAGTEGQEALQTRVDEVNPVAVPPISDPKAAAEDLVKKAEAAEAAAEKLLEAANKDGTITPEEVKAIEDANKAVEEAKAKADAAVKALPAGTEGQEALQTRVDEVNPVAVPPISDPKAAAEDLVKKAEAAEAAAEKLLEAANKDGTITPEEVKAIEDANKAVEEAKAKADAAVKALPAGTEGQEALQTRVDEVNPVAVPSTDTTADKPTIVSPDEDGKVEVTPGTDNTKVEVTVKDNDGKEQTVVAEKGADGNWAIKEPNPVGATFENGKIVIPADQVKDGEPVNAKGTDEKGNTADADVVNAGTDKSSKVTITAYEDQVGDVQGTDMQSGTTTDDANLILKGTSQSPNSTIYLFEQDIGKHWVKFAEVQTDGEGNWKYEVPADQPLTVKKHSFTASSSDVPPSTPDAADIFDVTVIRGEDQSFAESMKKIETYGVTISPLGTFIPGRNDSFVSMSANRDKLDVLSPNESDNPDFKLTGIDIPRPSYIQTGLGDFNGDGKNDILTTTLDYSSRYSRIPRGTAMSVKPYEAEGVEVTLISGVGRGSPRANLDYSNLDGGVMGVANLGDVNGDGLADVAVLGRNSSNVYFGKNDLSDKIAPNQKNLDFSDTLESSNIAAKAPRAASLGDFNGDGYADVVTNKGIFFGSADGLSNDNRLAFNIDVDSVYAAGDVNGDGYADAIVYSEANKKGYVVFGGTSKGSVTLADNVAGGNGGFAITGSDTIFNGKVAVSGIGDLDGDGLSDFIVATSSGGNYVLFGKNSSDSLDLTNLGVKGIVIADSNSHGLAIAGFSDFNGDGLTDFALLDKVATTKEGTPKLVPQEADADIKEAGKAAIFLGHKELNVSPTFQAISGEDTLGTKHSDFIAGSKGNDKIIGNGGADVIYSGQGNDVIVLNKSNLDALERSSYDTDGRVARVDGGQGIDTLEFAGDVTNIDLTKISNSGLGYMASGVGMSRISNIEVIDLNGGDNAARTLTIQAKDVLDMNHNLRSFNDIAKHQVKVLGDNSDVVKLTQGEWENDPTTVTHEGVSYNAYNQTGADFGAQLLIQEGVTVQLI
ncbi:GA-like domain-containing protein [Rodentibacter abscessus]|uniref:GA-like domain-containing protein n=1 Tax=Rodentibacter abscessus TaxID=3381777 RepID=UPI00399C5829